MVVVQMAGMVNHAQMSVHRLVSTVNATWILGNVLRIVLLTNMANTVKIVVHTVLELQREIATLEMEIVCSDATMDIMEIPVLKAAIPDVKIKSAFIRQTIVHMDVKMASMDFHALKHVVQIVKTICVIRTQGSVHPDAKPVGLDKNVSTPVQFLALVVFVIG